MLGVAQWQAKGNQNQMGPGLGPLAEAAVGPSRSWLLSRGCPGRNECKSGYIGVVHRKAHHCTASHIVDWHRDSRQTQARILTCSEGFTGGWRGQLCVLRFLRAFTLNEERHLWQNGSSKWRTVREEGSRNTRAQRVHCASTAAALRKQAPWPNFMRRAVNMQSRRRRRRPSALPALRFKPELEFVDFLVRRQQSCQLRFNSHGYFAWEMVKAYLLGLCKWAICFNFSWCAWVAASGFALKCVNVLVCRNTVKSYLCD